MRYPRDLGVWQYAPGRKLVEIVVRLKNVKGALAQCSKAVANADINMLSGFETASSVSRMGDWSFFADMTDSKVDLESLRRKLLALPVVVDVDILPADDGFMVDRQHFPLTFSNRRALILRTEALSEMNAHLWQVFGSGAATILDQMAESMGRYTAQELIGDFGKDFVVNALDEVLQTYSALGFAEVDVAREKGAEESLTVHAHQLFECEANARKKLRRKSIFFRGHLRGFISTVFQSDFEVTEVQCVAEGDEACSFVAAKVESIAPGIPLASEEQN